MEVVDTYQSHFHLMVISLPYLCPWWPAGWEHQLERKLRSKRDRTNRGMRGIRGRGTQVWWPSSVGVTSARRSIKKLPGVCRWLEFKELNRVIKNLKAHLLHWLVWYAGSWGQSELQSAWLLRGTYSKHQSAGLNNRVIREVLNTAVPHPLKLDSPHTVLSHVQLYGRNKPVSSLLQIIIQHAYNFI